MPCTLQSIALFHTVLTTGNRTPHPFDPIYSLCYFREQKGGSRNHGWIHERKKGVLLLVLAE